MDAPAEPDAAPAEPDARWPSDAVSLLGAGNSPLKTIAVVVHDDVNNRHPEEEIEGRDGGLWDYAVTDDDDELDDIDEEAAPDDASVNGRTYDDVTKSPPPHLRCVVSPLSSLPPVLGCTAASLSPFVVADVPGLRRLQAVFSRNCHSIVCA